MAFFCAGRLSVAGRPGRVPWGAWPAHAARQRCSSLQGFGKDNVIATARGKPPAHVADRVYSAA
ncbi:hypothetical protein FAM19317_02398 [Lacticaseibacillus paracasei]|nr:hypothetical protein FAM19317_02398 [Lacticaseibacillus paracasei]RNE37319.1 hypothetical protein FAM8140_02222 [Lacticaseibacillus paracasei]TDG86576.1 hypothetical protein C5L26_000711 [Lacticaseibacillus paracasei subsp. paracasei]